MDLQWLCRSRSNETSVNQVNRIRRYVNSLSCFLLCVLKFNWQMPTELPRWIPLLRYYQFTLVSLRAGGHWNWSLFGSFIIMRRQAKKKKKKINPTCIDDTLHVIFGRPFHMARQNAGEAETSIFRMDDGFVLTRPPISTVYIRHPGPWLLARRNGKSVMDRSLALPFSSSFYSPSLSPNVIHFFFLYSALFLYFPRSQHWSSPPTIRRMKARAQQQPANE